MYSMVAGNNHLAFSVVTTPRPNDCAYHDELNKNKKFSQLRWLSFLFSHVTHWKVYLFEEWRRHHFSKCFIIKGLGGEWDANDETFFRNVYL